MILNTVHLCYNAIHQPFASEGAAEIGNLNSRRSASAIIRAVLRSEGIDTQEAIHYSIYKCKCHAHGPQQEGDGTDDILNPNLTLKQLEIQDGDSVFIRKVDAGNQGAQQAKLQKLQKRSRIRNLAFIRPNSTISNRCYNTIENLPDDLKVLSMIYIESTVKYIDDREAKDGDVEGLDLSELRLVQFFQKLHLEESKKDDAKFRFEVVPLIQVDQDKVAAQGFSIEIALRGLALATWIRFGDDFSLNIRAPSTAPHSFNDHFFPVLPEYVGILADVDFGL